MLSLCHILAAYALASPSNTINDEPLSRTDKVRGLLLCCSLLESIRHSTIAQRRHPNRDVPLPFDCGKALT